MRISVTVTVTVTVTVDDVSRFAAKRTLKLLLKAGVDPNVLNLSGFTALQLAIMSAAAGRDDCTLYMLDGCGFDEDAITPDGKTWCATLPASPSLPLPPSDTCLCACVVQSAARCGARPPSDPATAALGRARQPAARLLRHHAPAGRMQDRKHRDRVRAAAARSGRWAIVSTLPSPRSCLTLPCPPFLSHPIPSLPFLALLLEQ